MNYDDTKRWIALRLALRRAEKFAKAWKQLAHVLEVDLRVARRGGCELAQELHEMKAKAGKEQQATH